MSTTPKDWDDVNQTAHITEAPRSSNAERQRRWRERQQAEGRTIRFEMTWRTAAQIIAAALENGTGAGREAARAELFRMADLLDQLNAEQSAAKEPSQ